MKITSPFGYGPSYSERTHSDPQFPVTRDWSTCQLTRSTTLRLTVTINGKRLQAAYTVPDVSRFSGGLPGYVIERQLRTEIMAELSKSIFGSAR